MQEKKWPRNLLGTRSATLTPSFRTAILSDTFSLVTLESESERVTTRSL